MTAPADPTTIPDEVLALLRQVYTDKGAKMWWTTRNRNLGGYLPAELWGRTHFTEARVMDEAQRLTGDLNG